MPKLLKRDPNQTYQVGPDANRSQATLTHLGRKHLGRDTIAEQGLSATEVRRAGGRVAVRGAAFWAAGAVALGGFGAAVNYGFDKSRSSDPVTDTQAQQLTEQIAAKQHNSQPAENIPSAAEVGARAAELPEITQ